jgi:hypothetical protein
MHRLSAMSDGRTSVPLKPFQLEPNPSPKKRGVSELVSRRELQNVDSYVQAGTDHQAHTREFSKPCASAATT